ncbi:maleylacetoacetate isomerase [Polaromonas sp. P1(28)-8]|nr:maleylacetoacetate isomerase [Polaromonas sp. P1(28)-8]
MQRVLHTYFRSSASYRVRIALNLKELEARHVFVHLNRDGGQQHQVSFKALNPQGLVPVLSEGDLHLSQSLAIFEYLEERYPLPPLLPASIEDRAYVRQLALDIACEIHPLNNLRVLKYLTGTLGLSEGAKSQWVKHWITLGLEALERTLAASAKRGRFCFGDRPTIADCCLVPQMFNAQRFEVDLSIFPTLQAIDRACQSLPAFTVAHPSVQSDAE